MFSIALVAIALVSSFVLLVAPLLCLQLHLAHWQQLPEANAVPHPDPVDAKAAPLSQRLATLARIESPRASRVPLSV